MARPFEEMFHFYGFIEHREMIASNYKRKRDAFIEMRTAFEIFATNLRIELFIC
jgi:hypothetical protein